MDVLKYLRGNSNLTLIMLIITEGVIFIKSSIIPNQLRVNLTRISALGGGKIKVATDRLDTP